MKILRNSDFSVHKQIRGEHILSYLCTYCLWLVLRWQRGVGADRAAKLEIFSRQSFAESDCRHLAHVGILYKVFTLPACYLSFSPILQHLSVPVIAAGKPPDPQLTLGPHSVFSCDPLPFHCLHCVFRS